ncbi:MAG TPA: hypothetical protein VHX88_01955 [Solirubrobacteraceae bacterium]|nr:hypothetical protein [Solirubrobacteraceae bacterium]
MTLGGQPIDLDPLVTDLANALKPLGFLITITPNEQFTDPVNGDTGVRALHIEVVPTSGGTPLVNLVVAESEVGGSTNVCNTAATGPPALATPTAQLPAGYGSFTGGQANQGVLGNGDVGTANSGIHPTCGKLSMHFVKAGKTIVHPTHSLTSHYGKRDVIRGTIVTCSKHPQPIVNAKIDQIHIFAGKKLIKTGLKSRPHGRLTLILPDNLTSRSILFQYRPNLNSSKVSSSVTLHLKVVR